MAVSIINPKTLRPLVPVGNMLDDMAGNKFPIIDGIPRIAELENYADSFGIQWNKFAKTQIDRDGDGLDMSRKRFFGETHWDLEDLRGKDILEVGSGAGRFTRVVLEFTNGNLYSVDYSNAVVANFQNNGHISPERFHLFQASIYEMPFPNDAFDKVFCLGVLQHTPDFEASVKVLIDKTKPGGEIVIDFYQIKGWWTKLHAKYLLRSLTTKMSHEALLEIIDRNIDWLIKAHFGLHRVGLGLLTRFLPVCNVKESFPRSLTYSELREWAILDTFDQYSPKHDHPQRLNDVAAMFERNGASVTFAGSEEWDSGMCSTVVRAVKGG